MKKITVLVMLVLSVLGIYSCSKDKDGQAKVRVMLTDAPGIYDAVYVDIQRIEFNVNNEWHTLNPVVPGVYNLMELSNGIDTLMGDILLPAGQIGQIRLILGSQNSVVVGGVSHPLNTPSGQQSGLKLNLHTTLEAGTSYTIWLDFDAGKSIVATGSGNYNLKPVIRAYSDLTNGRIQGNVLPMTANTIVYAISGTDTFSAIPDAAGNFLISGLPQGTYNVWFDADVATGFNDQVVNNVSVTFGNITVLPPVLLLP
ncbi:hypothetical protein D3C71_194230 [compost metagenome]